MAGGSRQGTAEVAPLLESVVVYEPVVAYVAVPVEGGEEVDRLESSSSIGA